MYDIRVTGEQPVQRGSEGLWQPWAVHNGYARHTAGSWQQTAVSIGGGGYRGGAGIGGGCDSSGIGGGDARRRASAVLVRSLACTS